MGGSAAAALEPMDGNRFETAVRALGDMDALGLPDGAAQFTITGSPSGVVSFHVVVDAGTVSVAPGRHPQPDVVIGWAHAALESALQSGHPLEIAYMSGVLKLEGDQVLLFDGWRSLSRSPQLKDLLAALR